LGSQKDSPVQIASVSTSTTYLFNGALILNGSESPLVELQIGWVMQGHRPGEERKLNALQWGSFMSVRVSVEPGKSGEIGAEFDWSLADLLSQAIDLGLEHFVLKFGIIRAKFADGTTFTYDLAAGRDFLEDPDNALAIKAHRALPTSVIERFTEKARIRADENQKLLHERKKISLKSTKTRQGLTGPQFLTREGKRSLTAPAT
ncbi:MAG TPA: hypothetical protein VGL91_17850, partial [Acidobacteriota bacterium]